MGAFYRLVLKAASSGLTTGCGDLPLRNNSKGEIALMAGAGSSYRLLGFNPEFTALATPPGSRIKPEMLATVPEQIESVVHIACNKGIFIRFCIGTIPCYANTCRVSLIAYRKNVTFAQQTITNSAPDKSVSLSRNDKEYTMPIPYQEIENFMAKYLPYGSVR